MFLPEVLASMAPFLQSSIPYSAFHTGQLEWRNCSPLLVSMHLIMQPCTLVCHVQRD